MTSIGTYAFSGCSSLTSVTIPNSVTSIGDYTFSFCRSLTSVTIPNSVTSIGQEAFCNCSGLTSITIPNSVTSIGVGAFASCSSLTSITIPGSVTSIGYGAFQDCSGLTSITIPNSVTSIGDYAFYGCYGLTSVTIPNSVTSIGDYAFYQCSGLTSVIIGNSVTSIGQSAFEYCYYLTSITIPNGVTSIGSHAFYQCLLTSIVLKIVDPFDFDIDVFEDIDKYTECVLIVPKGTRDAYIAAGWTEEVFKGGIIEDGLEVTISSAGFATFYDKYGDVIIPEGVTAYTATVRNGSVVLTEIKDGKIPVKTPVVLKGAPDTYEFSYTTGAEAVGDNHLRVSTGSLTADGTQYALTKKSGVVGFNKIKVGTAIPEGKVYLQAPSAGIKEFFAFEEDDATDIQNLNDNANLNETIYNLAGQRINKMQRGINIVNGKKILF